MGEVVADLSQPREDSEKHQDCRGCAGEKYRDEPDLRSDLRDVDKSKRSLLVGSVVVLVEHRDEGSQRSRVPRIIVRDYVHDPVHEIGEHVADQAC